MNNHPPEVLEKFKQLDVGTVGISSISVSELYYGACKGKKKRENFNRLEEFLFPFEILAYDENAAREYGKVRAQLEKKGQLIGPLDMLIAAHAMSRKLIVITNNTREFKRIRSLQVENWVDTTK
jgi:tRNA(fMet)-specific endonuclease VapC